MHSIISNEISQRWSWRQTKSLLKIWLLSVNFEKFTSINLWSNQSQSGVWKGKLVEVNFSKLMDRNQIFWNDFVCLYYHFCKISTQINECNFFYPYDFLQWTLYNPIYSMVCLLSRATVLQCASKYIYFFCSASWVRKGLRTTDYTKELRTVSFFPDPAQI